MKITKEIRKNAYKKDPEDLTTEEVVAILLTSDGRGYTVKKQALERMIGEDIEDDR